MGKAVAGYKQDIVKSWLLLWVEYKIRTRLIKVKEDQKPQDKKLFGTLLNEALKSVPNNKIMGLFQK